MNYQVELEKLIKRHIEKKEVPTLLLHACCAPCSSYCLEYLSQFFRITVLFYNPNIAPEEEYRFRAEELRRMIGEMEFTYPVSLLVSDYDSRPFYEIAKGLEDMKEGGERCFRCFKLRLRKTAELAKKEGFDYFTTTLSISPLKNAQKLNEIGLRLGEEYDCSYLVSDFKKKNGYKRSIELSKEHELYRQNYCGCIYSKRESETRENRREI